VEDAARLCADLGHSVEEAAPALPGDYYVWFLTIFLASAAQEFAMAEDGTGTKARRADVEDATWLCRQLGRSFSAEDLSLALERLHRASRAIARFFERHDLLLTPTLARPPVRHGELSAAGVEAALHAVAARLGLGGLMRHMLGPAAERAFAFVPFSPIWNATGQPAASLPLHRTQDGLPVGVQAVAGLGEEGTILSLAAQIEEARPWARRMPPG
jgi:amidase